MTQSLSHIRIMLALVTFGLTASLVAPRANADEWNKRTILTVNQTIQVRDTVLQPGQYVLQLLNSNSERHVVQIFNRDQSRIIGTVLAVPRQRVQPTGDSQFTFWETPDGYAKAMRSWFYPGDSFGQEFPYPQHPLLVAAVENPAPLPPPAPAMTPPAAAPSASAEPTPALEPTPEAVPEQSAAPEQTPPPAAPPAAEQAPTGSADRTAQPEPPQPAELPKTASRYPLLGISGLALLAFAGLLRLRRLA
jgi:LPXTG-motif cell wall-anchored protein